jgi:hypothetical protein
MPRQTARDDRFDAAGGVNTAFSPDVLDKTELRSVRNGRVVYGLIEKRRGSKRLHSNSIGAAKAVLGLRQWDAPGGQELVAVCNGGLYHKLAADAEFTFASGGLSMANVTRFATHRIGATIKLYLASDGLFQWDGAALTAVADAPAGVRDVAVYKLRMFAIAGTKTLYASKIGDPTMWAVASGGIQADVETYDTEPLTGLLVVGSSLLLFKADTIARFTGVDPDDIQIGTDTEGISPDVGGPYPGTIIPLEDAGFFLSDRGPYLATEAGVKEIALKIDREFSFDNKALWANAVAAAHRTRKEVWLSLPGDQETQNATTWVWNWKTLAWSGPFRGMPAAALARYELADGTETIVRGGYDGFVRQEDVPNLYKDDVLADGTGGTPVELQIEYPELFFGDPTRIKSLHRKQDLQADLGPLGELTATWISELGTGQTVIPSVGEGVYDYLYRLSGKGRRIRLLFTESAAGPVQITAINPQAYVTTRGGPHGVLAIPAGSVTITGAPASLEAGSTVQLTATVKDEQGNVVVRPVSWSSSDPLKATVDGTGLVTAVAAGPVTIIARSGGVTGQAAITITAFDDVAHLITDLGVTPPGVWSVRRGVKLNAAATLVNMIEDWRVRRTDGCVYFPNLSGQRITCGAYAGLNGAIQASIGIWFRNYTNSGYATNHRLRSGTFCGQWNTGGTRSWLLEKPDSSATIRLWFSDTDYAEFNDVDIHPGCAVKMWVVYDGTQVVPANRVKFYLQLFDTATGAWGATITPAVTVGGNGPPAAWPVGGEQFSIGGRMDAANPFWGAIDECRVIVGSALTQLQCEAEKVRSEGGSATQFAPDLWYSFENDSLANLGAAGAANDGVKGVDLNFCSDDLLYFPLVAQDTKRPGWDAVNQVVTFTQNQCLYSGEQTALGHLGGIGATYAQVTVVPVATASNWCVGCYVDQAGSGVFLGYNSGTGNILAAGTTNLDLGVAAGATRRAVAGVRPDNQALKGQVYNHAVAVGGAIGYAAQARGCIIVNGTSNTSQAGGVFNGVNGTQFRAAVAAMSLFDNNQLATFGAWAVNFEAAQVAA